MRRPFGVMVMGVLALALFPHVASASYASLSAAPNLQAALMQRVFGEVGDRSASVAATSGDTASESPLRAYALRVNLPQVARASVAQPDDDDFLAASPTLRLATLASYAATANVPSVHVSQSVNFSTVSAFRPITADYQPLTRAPAVNAGANSFQVQAGAQNIGDSSSLISFSPIFTPTAGFASSPGSIGGSGFAASQTSAISLPVGVRIGKLRVQTRFEGAQAESPQLSLQDRATGVGANFNVRAGARRVNVDVSSSFERFTRNGNANLAANSFSDTATLELPSDGAPVLVPSYADLSKHTLSTNFAVPVTRGLTLGLKYDTAHLLGGFGAPGVANLDAQANTYGAKLTYVIPHTSSALTLSAKQMRYQDNLLPINTYSQTRADVNFTVKF